MTVFVVHMRDVDSGEDILFTRVFRSRERALALIEEDAVAIWEGLRDPNGPEHQQFPGLQTGEDPNYRCLDFDGMMTEYRIEELEMDEDDGKGQSQ